MCPFHEENYQCIREDLQCCTYLHHNGRILPDLFNNLIHTTANPSLIAAQEKKTAENQAKMCLIYES